jgi:hypothetical protein
MNDSAGYAVFFFAPALEALGDAIKPYLQDGPAGPHVPCREVDTGGAFIEMTLHGQSPDGRPIALELMVPGNMVRMIVSAHSDNEFGFYDRNRAQAMLEPGMPVIAPADPAPVVEAPPVQSPVPATAD